ncbi:hypothetical protein ABIC55_002237 [Sporosarcina psychrophila]|uniref:Uncharacterized protein n=1 Tax=Sporosarcina psychrophila TaxID=1476 RepID=A0ABV2K7U9_SPOPS
MFGDCCFGVRTVIRFGHMSLCCSGNCTTRGKKVGSCGSEMGGMTVIPFWEGVVLVVMGVGG